MNLVHFTLMYWCILDLVYNYPASVMHYKLISFLEQTWTLFWIDILCNSCAQYFSWGFIWNKRNQLGENIFSKDSLSIHIIETMCYQRSKYSHENIHHHCHRWKKYFTCLLCTKTNKNFIQNSSILKWTIKFCCHYK